jgi:hypothetical protein
MHLQQAVERYREAPLLLSGWSLAWVLLSRLVCWLPLPLAMQLLISLLLLNLAMAGLLEVAEPGGQLQRPRLPNLLEPLRRQPLPLVLLPLLAGCICALAALLLVIPGLVLAFAWSLSLPVLIDRGGEAWDALGLSFGLVRSNWLALLLPLLVLVVISLLLAIAMAAAPWGFVLLGLWLPLAAFLLQGVYRPLAS